MSCLNKIKKASVTCKVYFVFIYKWQLFYYQIKEKSYQEFKEITEVSDAM